MKTKYFLIIWVILVITVISAVAYQNYYNNIPTLPDRRDVIYHDPPLLDVNLSNLRQNVTQGSTLQVNITLTSRAEQELTIPIENLTLTGFNNTAWDNSIPQNKLLNPH